MSEAVERRLVQILDHPTVSPYGNPIPGLEELGESPGEEDLVVGLETLDRVVPVDGADHVQVLIRRFSEPIQFDGQLMGALRRVGALPGQVVTVTAGAEGVLIGSGGETAEIDSEAAEHIFVRRA